MEKRKDTKRIKRILKKGETSYKDQDSGYTYTLCALCPEDSHECSMVKFEKDIGETLKISRVNFYCPVCNTRFDAEPEEMFLR